MFVSVSSHRIMAGSRTISPSSVRKLPVACSRSNSMLSTIIGPNVIFDPEIAKWLCQNRVKFCSRGRFVVTIRSAHHEGKRLMSMFTFFGSSKANAQGLRSNVSAVFS